MPFHLTPDKKKKAVIIACVIIAIVILATCVMVFAHKKQNDKHHTITGVGAGVGTVAVGTVAAAS